ncbi:AbrB/MazE/SpoVT family DNA-binding domain-containing protein [Neobacillus pocheonensis]|uniref:AbrB/MazE/SpoVT family DNA-binding domain-containing protein n=1 Tax=Neobacillus pocheonensis TaxID=363869 RepID=UPI003D2E5B3D
MENVKYETGKLSAKGVVAIPVKVRNILGVEEGDKLEFVQVDGEIVVRGIKRKSIMKAFGSWNIELDKPLVDVREVRDQYREERIADDLARQN